MSETVAELLLHEFRSFRDTEFRSFRDDVNGWMLTTGERITKVEVVAEGAASDVEDTQGDIDDLKHRQWFWTGVGSAVGTLLGYAIAIWSHITFPSATHH